MDIKLGTKVRCMISGYEGIATAEIKYINGCKQYCVAGRSIDNKPGENVYIDHSQLEIVDGFVSVNPADTGGFNQYQPK